MTTVLPQIDSFAKSRCESDSEIYEDNQQSTSPVSTDSDRVKPYVPDLSIKFEHQEHDSVITYGGDDVVDNYENVSFRNLLTDQQPEWPVYSLSPEMDTSSHQFYPVQPTYQSVECGQVVPNYNFDLEPTLTAEVPQYYPEVYPTEQPHRVSVIVGNSEHGDVQYGQQEFQMPYYSSQVFESPPITYKRKEKRKEKKKSPKSVIYFEKSELTPDHKNGIHLWQFLLSLLRQPKFEKHIKWVDQARGIFKIEDSQEVARLWGLRKNRPNMNYDKLSRSIRQYYKKNIIKKPKETSRLVYQFCDKIISDNKFAVKSIMCE